MAKTFLAKEVWRVNYTERDSWSGPSHGGHRDFTTKAGAVRHQKAFNSKNNLPYVPEFYIIAEEPVKITVKVEPKTKKKK